MIHKLGVRFWVKSALAALTGVLGLVTVVWQDWIEAVFGVDPDGGDGSVEWAIVVLLFAATVAFTLMARADWRRRAVPGLTSPFKEV
jgi:hypothetical protein